MKVIYDYNIEIQCITITAYDDGKKIHCLILVNKSDPNQRKIENPHMKLIVIQ